jgi:hypothetical protein
VRLITITPINKHVVPGRRATAPRTVAMMAIIKYVPGRRVPAEPVCLKAITPTVKYASHRMAPGRHVYLKGVTPALLYVSGEIIPILFTVASFLIRLQV